VVQAVSLQPLILKPRVQSQTSPCGICGRKSGTETWYSLALSFHLCCTFVRSPNADVIRCYKLKGSLSNRKSQHLAVCVFRLCHKSILIIQIYHQGNKCRDQCVKHTQCKIWSPAITFARKIELDSTQRAVRSNSIARVATAIPHSTRLDRVYTQHVSTFAITTSIYRHDVSSRPTCFPLTLN